MKNITLTDNQYDLLISILKNYCDELTSCSCNDIDVEKLHNLGLDELQNILNNMGKKYAREQYKEWISWQKFEENSTETWEEALRNGWGLFNFSIVDWLISVIKKQSKKKK